MHYKDYSAEDFIQDELFQEWVYRPDVEKDAYWKTFLEHHPHQQATLEEARRFLLLMKFERKAPDSLLNDIQARINDAIDQVEAGVITVALPEEPKRRALHAKLGLWSSCRRIDLHLGRYLPLPAKRPRRSFSLTTRW